MTDRGSSHAKSASTSLIRRLKTRDDAAWQRLLDLYVPLIFSWCRHSGLTGDDAADVVQDVFRSVHNGIAGFQYKRSGDTFRGWLRTITRNKINDHFRKQAKQPVAIGGTDAHQRFMELAETDSPESPDSGAIAGLMHRAMDLIHAEFEERTWRAFWLATVDNRSTGDIAEHLGMSPGAVRQAKYKVLRRLREELGDSE